MNKKYVVIQEGIRECGSACLLSIIKYYGGNISLNKLLALTNTNKDGTNFYNLKEAANEIGISAKGYKTEDINKLVAIEKPFISQVIIENYLHFVVVYKIDNLKVIIMDPAKGMIKLSTEEFMKISTGYILLLEPYKILPIYENKNHLQEVIKEIIYKNISIITIIITLSLISILFTCLYSYHFKIIIDNIIETDKWNLLIIIMIFALILTIRFVTIYLRNNLIMYLNQKIDLSIITTTIKKIISLPFSYYKDKPTGDVISRINDLMYIKNAISKLITNIFIDTILSICTIIILLNINKSMTIGLIIITLIYFLIYILSKNHIKNLTNDMQIKTAKVNNTLIETIKSYETIKGLNMEKHFENRIDNNYLSLIKNSLAFNKLTYTTEFIKDISEGIISLLTTGLGISYVMDKSLTIGALITYQSLIHYYLNPIRNFLGFYQELYYIKNSIKRINTLLDYKSEPLENKNNLELEGGIKIKNLDFCYAQNKILDNITVYIPEKSKVIIIGTSGSGKSTLLKILFSYYQIPRDKIILGRYDINDYSLSTIRNNITYISQNEFLYTDTIRNNILLDRKIEESEFLKICKLTHIDDFIKDNILTYDYMLEEDGTNISGGQRQRIILARALVRKSKIYLIDESLNEIDIELERKILKNIFKEYYDKTFIIISHRVDNMDLYTKVIKINNGKQVEGLNRYV